MLLEANWQGRSDGVLAIYLPIWTKHKGSIVQPHFLLWFRNKARVAVWVACRESIDMIKALQWQKEEKRFLSTHYLPSFFCQVTFFFCQVTFCVCQVTLSVSPL